MFEYLKSTAVMKKKYVTKKKRDSRINMTASLVANNQSSNFYCVKNLSSK